MRDPSPSSGRRLTHEEARLRLQLSLDGRLPNGEAMRLAAHLDGCLECRAEALSNRSMLDLWQQREVLEPSVDLRTRIMAQVVIAQPARRPTLLAPLFATSGGVLLVLAWFLGGLTASASGLAEAALNAATAFLADPLTLWNAEPGWPSASLPVAVEALLTAALGVLLIVAAGVLTLPMGSQQTLAPAEGAR